MSIRLASDMVALAFAYDAGAAWETALAQSLEYLVHVLEANPKASILSVLHRPDVADSLSQPFIAAGAHTMGSIREAWYNAIGFRDIPMTDLDRTLTTARRNTINMPLLVRRTLYAGKREDIPDRLKVLSRQMARRAEMGVEYAHERGTTLAQIYDAQGHGTKTWHCTDDERTCSHCRALDGVSIPISAAFDHEAGTTTLGTYGKLIGPPRHPHCRCHLSIEA